MTNRIYAQKGNRKTRFTELIWRGMGKNKNGWTQITQEQYEGNAPDGLSKGQPNDLTNETEYRKLYDQGKALEKDGKLVQAKAKLEKALAVKSSPALKGMITKLGKAIEAEEGRKELIAMGDEAIQAKDYDGAIEAYESAQEVRTTDDITEKIKEAKQNADLL